MNNASPVSKCIDRVSGFSIVVPTHGRVGHIERLLPSLEMARSRCLVSTEVLIVDSSPIDEAERIKLLCGKYDAVYVSGPINVRKKRNAGIQLAHHSIIVFIDSDCQAHPNLLAQYLKSYEEQPYLAGVLGQIMFTGPKNWVWEIVRFTPFINSFSFAAQWPYAIWGPTANISYKRDLLLELGMFDESFPFRLGGDDVDLGLRVTKSGRLLRCNPNAMVYHARDTWTHGVGILSRAIRWGRMEFHLLCKHQYLQQTDHPKLTVLLSILSVSACLLSLFTRRWGWLVLPWAWLWGAWVVEWALGALATNVGSWHPGRLVAQIVAWCYELGFCYESMRRGQPRLILQRPLFHVGQLSGEWPARVRRLWSAILATSIFILLLPWLK